MEIRFRIHQANNKFQLIIIIKVFKNKKEVNNN